MTLFRRPSRLTRLPGDFSAEIDAGRARQAGEVPQRQDPGPVTAPRLFAPMGPVDPASDPCGAPPISSSEKEGGHDL